MRPPLVYPRKEVDSACLKGIYTVEKMIQRWKKTCAADDLIIVHVYPAPAILPLFVPITPALSVSGWNINEAESVFH